MRASLVDVLMAVVLVVCVSTANAGRSSRRHEQAGPIDAEQEAIEAFGREIGTTFMKTHFGGGSLTPTLKPVMFIPGLGGSELDAKLNRTHVVHFYCTKHSDWELLWLDITEFASLDCFFSNLMVRWDPTTNAYSSAEGVTVAPVGQGTMDGVNYIDNQTGRRTITQYMAVFTQAFTAAGYVAGQNLRAFTYDFRMPPTAQGDYFARLAAMIETMYTASNNTPVVLIGHSMGGPMGLYFLSTVSQEWKDQYLDCWISLGAPFGGAPQIARTVVSGSNLGLTFFNISIVNAAAFAQVVRQWGGVIWMTPTAALANDECMFSIADTGACYGPGNMSELYIAANATSSSGIYEATLELDIGGYAPNVTTYCFIGYNISTEYSYSYSTITAQPTIAYGDGDGTVPTESAAVCEGWKERQIQPMNVMYMPNVAHSSMPTTPVVLNQLLAIATGVSQ